MSFTTSEFESELATPEATYRPLSSAGVASLVLGLLSITSFFDWSLLVVPLIGLFLGIFAFRKIRAHADEMCGDRLALWGIIFSAICLFGGASYQVYDYATEVPEGFARLDYAELQPDPDHAGEIIPPSVMAYDGKPVFLRGYPLQGSQMEMITTFILCRDRGECCFGGNPKPTDQVLVHLPQELAFSWRLKLFRVAGIFHVHPPKPGDPKGRPYYSLDGNYLR